MPSCFDVCSCRCNEQSIDFDRIISQEMRIELRLHDICHSNVGWYIDKTISISCIQEWFLGKKSGIYVLWHKNDYCHHHNLFHLKALYVGKGRFVQRFVSHWRKKDTSDEMILYFTYIELENRVAKYVEQLLLDIYNFPLNVAEKRGNRNLCSYLTQAEVD